MTAWCEYQDIPYVGVPVGTWKKTFTGRGDASKETITAAAHKLGHNPKTFDESDALGILYHGLAKMED